MVLQMIASVSDFMMYSYVLLYHCVFVNGCVVFYACVFEATPAFDRVV